MAMLAAATDWLIPLDTLIGASLPMMSWTFANRKVINESFH
jgi:hypothetical protein